jgi:hypothetical protein
MTEETKYTGESYRVVETETQNKTEEKKYTGESYWVVEAESQNKTEERNTLESPTE